MIKLLLLAVLSASAAEPSVTIAFVADSGMSRNTRKVFELIRAEGAQAVVHLGDLAYSENDADAPARFEKLLGETLKDIPFYAALGNHDEAQRTDYVAMLDRLDAGGACSGKRGVDSVCSISGVDVVFNARPGKYWKIIQEKLSKSSAKWKVCAWHEPDPAMHPGKNNNGPGAAPYSACLAAGAFVATGHQHQYSRTYAMDDFKNRKVVSEASEITLQPGRSFSVVAGAGGLGKLDNVEKQTWHAAIYARKDGDKNGRGGGALFCVFTGIRAECRFKSIDGKEYDRFTLVSGL